MIREIKFIVRASCAALALVFAAAANATSMVPVNLAQIVENTEKAFIGTVVSVQTVQIPKGWADKITVKVSEPVLGIVRVGEIVDWLQYRPGKEFTLAGMPTYTAGDEHLIFLAGKGHGTQFQAAYGLGQGSFRIHRNKETGEAIARNEFMNSSLFSGLDAGAVADAVIAQSAAGLSLDSAQRQAASIRMEAGLANAHFGGTELGSITSAAKAMAANAKPSQKFAKSIGGQPTTNLIVPLMDDNH